jgi:hypothetical protein
MLYLCSRMVLTVTAVAVALGGLYDVFTPRLPANLAARCHGNENIQIAVRELLRALGACLAAIGATVGILANATPHEHAPGAIALILILVLPSEGANALGMHRVGSPYVVPLVFIFLALVGAGLGLLAWETR